jgi:hypothetical protein
MENAQVLGIRIEKTPTYIGEARPTTSMTCDHPFPFQRSWEGGGSTDIENKFSIRVDMTYEIKKEDKPLSTSEKLKQWTEKFKKDAGKTDAQEQITSS